jgi:hypothetical protein
MICEPNWKFHSGFDIILKKFSPPFVSALSQKHYQQKRYYKAALHLKIYNRQRFSAWRCGGFLVQKFNKITAVEPCTNVS